MKWSFRKEDLRRSLGKQNLSVLLRDASSTKSSYSAYSFYMPNKMFKKLFKKVSHIFDLAVIMSLFT